MSKTFMPDLQPNERLAALRNHCDKSEQTTYYRDLSGDEIDAKCAKLVDNLIQVSGFEEELDTIKEEFKDKIKPLTTANKKLQVEVKTRKEQVEGTLFHIANYDDGMMETYDEDGQLLQTRRLRPDEKQAKLFIAQAANQ